MTPPSEQQLYGIATGRSGQGLVFAPGASGWAAYRGPGFVHGDSKPGEHPPFAFVRFAHGPGEALVVREVLIEASGAGSVGAAGLRALPVGRLESAVNQPDHLAHLQAVIEDTTEPHLPLPDADGPDGWSWEMYVMPKATALSKRLRIPKGHKKPDTFYAQVAERFAYLSSISARPAAELAEANDVPITTIHGWVKEARRRGLLPAGERNRKGQS